MNAEECTFGCQVGCPDDRSCQSVSPVVHGDALAQDGPKSDEFTEWMGESCQVHSPRCRAVKCITLTIPGVQIERAADLVKPDREIPKHVR